MIPEFHGILRKLSHAVFEISPDVVALSWFCTTFWSMVLQKEKVLVDVVMR